LLFYFALLFLKCLRFTLRRRNSQAQPLATIKPAEELVTPTSTSLAGGKYFQEDFNGDLSNWSQFVVNGSKVAKAAMLRWLIRTSAK